MPSLKEKTDYDVLNVVALKKMATAEQVADATGLEEARVTEVLSGLAETGLVTLLGEQALPGETAVPTLEDYAATAYDAARQDPDILLAADRFEKVNSAFLGAMSDWQLVSLGGRSVPNDHSDAEYDDKVITRINRLVERLNPILLVLAGHDRRFMSYETRFRAALDAVDRGDTERVSSPTIDSVHNVWFEFHEDLLRTLGRARQE
ncbi:TrmB family transcriptional regulator [Ornithinicoccus hortensis]|uniref:Uncharacterized protein n=1 Tax=Ornithinicoccus hortensis TaxID=82346 RepID=A0A542YTB9_9MICO|nr:TrmB family transcriptional regulator [Ornithinicoccus hortensis]TQL51342.1 hypothetical protein FB467_2484 [Ornithinicoccus hortensis]